jgi:hypothetical protein
MIAGKATLRKIATGWRFRKQKSNRGIRHETS